MEISTNRVRYTLDEIQRNVFYQLPKFLFEGEFKKLNNDARVLYSMLRDRHDLSIQNRWVNEKNEVYLLFSRENMCDMLGLSDKTVTEAMNELRRYGLIEEQRRGQGKPNLIFLMAVKSPQTLDNIKTRRISGSENGKSPVLESENLRGNDTDFTKTDAISYPIQSNLSGQKQNIKTDKDMIREDEIPAQPIVFEDTIRTSNTNSNANSNTNRLANWKAVKNRISKNIDYDTLIFDKPHDKETLDGLVQIIVSTICADFKDGYISMGEERIPAEAVKEVFLKLNMFDILYFLDCYNQQTGKISKLTSYVRKSLFNNHGTTQLHYSNRVRVDMPYMVQRH